MKKQTKKGKDDRRGYNPKTVKTICLTCDKKFNSPINIYGRAAYRTCYSCMEKNSNINDTVYLDRDPNAPIKYLAGD